MKPLLIILLLPGLLAAQNAAFTAMCNAKGVIVGQPFEVSFRLENDKFSSFTPPDFKDVEVLGGPSSMTSVSYINGKATGFEARSYTLAARKPGELTIGAAKATTAQGKSLTSNTLKVSVAKGEDNNNSNNAAGNADLGDRVLLRLEASSEQAVVGEQIIVDLKIYSQIGIEQIELLREPEATNMFSHQVQTFDEATNLEVLNGKQYRSKILRRLVLFPSKTGSIPLEAAVAQLGIVQSGNTNSLFGVFQRLQTYKIKSNALNIQVRALDGGPTGFQGAVGSYEMQAYTEKNSITSDDVIQVRMRIIGEGDIKQVMPPSLNLPAEQFEVFPPNVKDEVREGRGVLGGIKEIEYIVSPKAVGTVEIRPELVFYDPKKRQFVRLDTVLTVQIAQGSRVLPNINSTPNKDSTAQARTLEPLPPQSLGSLGQPGTPWVGSWSFWLLCLLPVALSGVWAWRYEREKARRAAITQDMLRQGKAAQEAQKRLSAARQALQNGQSAAFYDAVLSALLGYAADKFLLPAAKLSHEELRRHWQTLGLDSDFIGAWSGVVSECEWALFGKGAPDPQAMQRTYQKAAELMQQLEKQAATVSTPSSASA